MALKARTDAAAIDSLVAYRYSARDRFLVLLAAFLGWGFDGLEQGIFPLIGNDALMELTGGVKQAASGWFGYIMAGWLFGAAAGGFVFGWLGDKIGRVRAMALSILMYSLFTGLGYFAQAPWHLLGLRFIAALGMGGEWALGVALVMECWPEKWRPYLAGCIGAAANLGFLLIALITWRHPVTPDSWRWVMLAGAVPAFLTFFIRLFVPESQRWVESVRRHGPSRPAREIFSRALVKNTLFAVAFASIALIGTWASIQYIARWVNETISPGIPANKSIAQAAIALGAVIGSFFAPIIGGLIGRRPAYFGLCLASFLLCGFLFWGHVYGVGFLQSFNAGFVFLVFLTGMATAAFFGWLPLYLPELFPTRVRATGQGLGYNFGRILAGVAALSTGSIIVFFGSLAKMGGTVTLIYLVGMVLIWFAPETKGKPLPE